MRQILKYVERLIMWRVKDTYYATILLDCKRFNFKAPSLGALEAKVGKAVKKHYGFE